MAVFISLVAGAGWQFFTNDGKPLAGGLLYTYSAGTTTPLATYTDNTGLIANTNPIVLDAAGRPPAEVWLTAGSNYKFVVKDSSDVLIRTYDNIPSTPLPTYPLSIANGGTNATSFNPPVAGISPLVYFDGTRLVSDAAPSDLGYKVSTDTFYVNNLSLGGTATIAGNVVFSSTGAIKLPTGTTAQEPSPPLQGMIRFNTTTTQFEGYNGSYWTQVGGGATGGGQDQIFVLNGQTVTTNYSIPSGMNAMSTGPITIDTGISVTVPTGSNWAIIGA